MKLNFKDNVLNQNSVNLFPDDANGNTEKYSDVVFYNFKSAMVAAGVEDFEKIELVHAVESYEDLANTGYNPYLFEVKDAKNKEHLFLVVNSKNMMDHLTLKYENCSDCSKDDFAGAKFFVEADNLFDGKVFEAAINKLQETGELNAEIFTNIPKTIEETNALTAVLAQNNFFENERQIEEFKKIYDASIMTASLEFFQDYYNPDIKSNNHIVNEGFDGDPLTNEFIISVRYGLQNPNGEGYYSKDKHILISLTGEKN